MAEEPREWEREWLTIPQSHSGSEICTQDVIPVAETVTLKRIQQGFPLGQRGAHPPKAMGLQDN